jgi:predicted outer membrane repeat protein
MLSLSLRKLHKVMEMLFNVLSCLVLFWNQIIFITDNQCCGSGSGIRCIFTLWIRDEFFPDPGSRGYRYVFW